MRAIKIKVPRLALIQRVKEVRDSEQVDYERRRAEYEVACTAWISDVADFYEGLAQALRSGGDLPPRRYGAFDTEPEEPREPREADPTRHNRLLRQLEMATDEVLTITTTDYSEYL